jgi:hypothetical protein
MQEWVELSPNGGKLNVVIEYEPYGMEPQVSIRPDSRVHPLPVSLFDLCVGQVNDVVFFEAFARSHRSLIFPINEPMVVEVSPPL